MSNKSYFRAFFAALVLLFCGGLAHAQATRTWVSGVGDDVNPCSRTAPCKTFAGAISKTAAGGEIDALDPGGFGTLTITKAISIVGVATNASILASGTNGINVNAGPNDDISIRNITINGAGTTLGVIGINFISGRQLHVEDCAIYNFSQAGIAMDIPSAFGRLYVLHSSIFQNVIGLKLNGGSVGNGALVDSSFFDANTSANIAVAGSNASVTLTNTSLQGSVGVAESGSPTVQSFGNNAIIGTPAVITHTIPLQ